MSKVYKRIEKSFLLADKKHRLTIVGHEYDSPIRDFRYSAYFEITTNPILSRFRVFGRTRRELFIAIRLHLAEMKNPGTKMALKRMANKSLNLPEIGPKTAKFSGNKQISYC